jgi:hypothetical protein
MLKNCKDRLERASRTISFGPLEILRVIQALKTPLAMYLNRLIPAHQFQDLRSNLTISKRDLSSIL